MESKDQDYSFDSVSIIGLVIKWKRTFFIITLIAIISSIAAAYIIDEKFKSTVILFPSTTNSISKTLLTANQGGHSTDLLEFGAEEHAEQLLQILNSDVIRDKVIEEFELITHYEIKDNSAYPKTEMYEEYKSNISFRRTEFMAVEIEVLDKNPETAAKIANYIAKLLDDTKTSIQKERAVEAYKIVERAYHDKIKFIDSMRDSLKFINKQGVYDVEQQSLALNEAYAKALMSNNKSGIKVIEEKLKILAEYSSDYMKLSESMIFELAALSEVRVQYERAKVDAEKSLPHTFIINRAVPAEKKSYPVRWLIVSVSTISTILLTLIAIILIENVRQYTPQELKES
ncbi:MAG: hypothetical protein JKX95_01605 [Bacteroidia bacterium]|nr:hypothetical protein [Bacteroidia bacterium]